jgi:hypothetical protein
MTFENFFRQTEATTIFFDEGPRLQRIHPSGVHTSSIDTSLIDPFRQGVELTHIKHFDAGIVKIHAGEPGHGLKRNGFGMGKSFIHEPIFKDVDCFTSPVDFIEAQLYAQNQATVTKAASWPAITDTNDNVLDGVIEPLLLRKVPTSTIFRTVAGTVMSGNPNQFDACDQVLTVDQYEPLNEQIAYFDMVDMFNDIPMNEYFTHERATLSPFDDVRLPRNVAISTTYESAMDAALSLMTGSSDNYISPGQKSAASGWYYDNASMGTDSISFGGMVY